MKRLAVLLSISVFAVIFGQPAFADTYYQGEGLGAGGGGVYSEANGPTVVYDNFTLAGNSVISHLSWVGISTVDIGVGPAASDYFEADFYTDNGGVPGTLVSSNVLHISGIPYTGAPDYYAYDAAVNVTVTAGTEYWLSIYSVGTSSQYAWDKGYGGDGKSLVYYNPAGTGSYTYAHDAAFTLTYDAAGAGGGPPPPPPPLVPEPSGLVLMATGLLSVTKVIRKRFKA